MDRDVTLYQITNVMAERVFQKQITSIKAVEDAGYYAISVSTPYRSYYALWRIFPDNIYSPLFIQSLAVTFNDAAERAFQYLQNCNVLLKVKDNTFLNLIMEYPRIQSHLENIVEKDQRRFITLILTMYFGWHTNLRPEILGIRSWQCQRRLLLLCIMKRLSENIICRLAVVLSVSREKNYPTCVQKSQG